MPRTTRELMVRPTYTPPPDDVAAALARAYEFCPPGTTAEVAALRAVADAVRRMRAVDAGVPHYGPVMELYAALDALPPTDAPAGGGEA